MFFLEALKSKKSDRVLYLMQLKFKKTLGSCQDSFEMECVYQRALKRKTVVI